ncbi:MAG: DUF6760 family protein [Anaerolineae bacterium]
MSYPSDRLHEEVAFLAIGLGWSRESILELTHRERHAWIAQVNRMNTRANYRYAR